MRKFKGGFKRIYSLIALVVSVLTFILIPLEKSDAIVVTNNGIMNRLFFMNRTTGKQILTAVKRDAAGNYIYCGEERKDSPRGHDMQKEGEYNYQAYVLLSNGYPHKSFTGDGEADYFITQMAFWALVDSGHVDLSILDAYVDYSKRDDVWNHVKNLYDKAKAEPENYTFSIDFNKKLINCTRDGDNFVSEWLTLEASPGIDLESVKFTASDGVYCAYKLRDGSLVPDVPINREFQVIVPVSQTQGSCTITATGNIRKPVVNRLACSDPAIQRVAQYQKELTPYSANFNLVWPTNGDLEVTKTDADTGAGLQGAVFEVRKDGVLFNNTILTSGADGKTQTVSLPAGDYTIVETQAPTGYVINNTPIAVSIQATNKSAITATNTKVKGKLKIVKKDADNGDIKLQGAEFKLYKKVNDQLITTLTTNSDGEALSGELEIGDYYIQETNAPSGYVLNSNKIDFSITSANPIVTKEVTNKKIQGKLKVIKTDETATGRLQGAEFTIYRKSNNSIVEVINTGTNGEAISNYLDIGDYYFKETQAPTGYVIDSTRYDFTVDTNDKVYSFTVSNAQVKSTIKIAKIDADTNKPLKGATFKLYRKADDSEVTTVTTSSNGFAMLNSIPYGEYYVVETIAPQGYVLNSARQDITITDNNNTYTFSFTNKVIKGGLTITKVDGDTGSPLQGAEFKIYNSADKELSTVTTDNKGKAVVNNLSYGDYYFKESKAPTGYFANSTKVNFRITTNGEMVTKTVENNKVKGRISIVKSAAEDPNTKLQGAVFGIYDKATNTKVEEITTNENGEATSSALNYGTYYVKELQAPVGYNINVNTFDVSVESDKLYLLNITDKIIKGKLKVIKTDGQTVTKLAGAEFTIYQKDTDIEVGKIVTNNKGEAISSDLTYGNYYFKETKAPEGYQLDGTIKEFNVDTDAKLYEYNIENHKITGIIQINKVDRETGVGLQGAVFGVYNKTDNTQVATLTTDAQGQAASTALPYGDYYVKELTAPNGYLIDQTKHDVSIGTQNATTSITINNDKIKGKLKVIKTDGQTVKKLEGAEFTIYNKDTDAEVGKVVTNKKGEATSADLPFGRYYFVETKAPTGYAALNTRFDFEVEQDAGLYEFTVNNNQITGQIRIIKKDEASGAVLQGAVFGVYKKSNDTKVAEVTTDVNGVATTVDLPYGEYYVKEITPPVGYEINTNKFNVNIDTPNKVYDVEVLNKLIKGKLKVIKTDGETITRLQGAEFTVFRKLDDVEVTKIVTGTNGEAITDDLVFGEYYFKETKAPAGYDATAEVFEFSVAEQGKLYEYNIENTLSRATIKILKKDAETGKALSKAVFKIYNADTDTEVETIKTGSNGIGISKPLPLGNYYVKEITAPNGYVLENTRHDVNLSQSGATNEIEIANTIIKGRVKILKTDAETNATLEGAVFGVYNKIDDTEVARLTTGKNGEVTSDLLNYGNYYFKELTPPNGYNLNGDVVDFSITENGKVYEYTVENRIVKGSIKIIKKDEETDNTLEGAVFEILRKDSGALVETVTTNDKGVATSGLLNYGEYVVKEKTPPNGYNLNTTTFDTFIQTEGAVNTIEVTNRIIKGYINIIKTDEETGASLKDVEFGIYRKDNDKEVCKLITGDDGTIKSPALDFGEYYVKELKAATGYNMNTNTFDVNINAEGKTYDVNITNRIIKGKLKVVKIDAETFVKLPNAVFGVYSKVDNAEVCQVTTGADGTIETPWLNYGDYYFKELTPPEGYLLNTNTFDFSIREEGKVYEFTVNNQPIKGKISVTKRDAELPDLAIPGVVFEVKDKNKKVVATLVTDNNGYVETDLLRYGEYTIEEKTPKEGYLPNATVHTVFIREHGITYNVDVTNQVIKGNIQIVKIDEEHEERPVANAEFTVYAVNVFGIAEGTEIEKVITGVDGFAYTSDLRYGNYRIVETRSPEGYYDNDREYYMDITENGKTYIRYISNKPIEAKLVVNKTDEVTGEGLQGVKFEIIDNKTQEAVKFTRIAGKEVETFTEFVTDENGDFITPQALGYGEYTLVETEALLNYVEAEPIEFKIAETTPMEDIEGVGTVTTMGVTNKELEGELKLNKLFKPTEIDGLDENGNYTQPIDFYLMRNMAFVADSDMDLSKPYPLHFANFNLYKLNSDKLYNDLTNKEQKTAEWTLIDTYSTDLNGVLNIAGLKYGSYKLEEVDIPANFNAVEDIYFDITTDGDVFETEVENSIKTGDVEITKFDIHDGTLLPNAHFEILDENKNIVLSGITDENGLFKFKLAAGKYYYKETQAPVFEGTEYVLDEGEYPFEIKEDGEIVKCKAPNKKRVAPKTSLNAPLMGVGIGIVIILISTVFIFYRRRSR